MSEAHYLLVNPYIEGNVHKMFRASSPNGAAKEAWMEISKYITGAMPTFHISLQRASNDTLYHFKIEEGKDSNDRVSFTVEQYMPNIANEGLQKFKKNLEDAKKTGREKLEGKQSGGKRKDDSSSSSSSEEYYKPKKNKLLAEQPIVYWWYDPIIYGIDKFWVPTFISPLFPAVEVVMSLYPSIYIP